MIKILSNYKIIRFIFSGGISAVFHLTVLYVLVNYFNLWYLTSASIAFCIAVMINYLLQKIFTFKDYSTTKIPFQFSIFFSFAFSMFCLNAVLMYLLVDIIGLWYMFAQVIAAVLTAFLNYYFFNQIVFNIKKVL